MLVDSTSIPLRNLQSSPPASCHDVLHGAFLQCLLRGSWQHNSLVLSLKCLSLLFLVRFCCLCASSITIV